MDTNPILRKAALAAKAGDKVQARALLKAVIQQEPRNEAAWLLFAEVAEKDEHAIFCLLKVLELNPSNESAKSVLNALRHQTSSVMASQRAPQGNKKQLPILAMFAMLVGITFVVGAMLVFWRGLSTAESQPIEITVVVSDRPTLPPASTATTSLSDPCLTDPLIASQYSKVLSNSTTTISGVLSRMTAVMRAYTNAEISVTALALETDVEIPQLESVYIELRAVTPPSPVLSEPHSILLNGLLLEIESIKAVRTYTATLDAAYLAQALELEDAAFLLFNESSAGFDRYAKECGSSPF